MFRALLALLAAGGAAHAAALEPARSGAPTVVLEAGERQVLVLEGERLEPLGRLLLRHAPQGAPKLSPDGRFAYFGSREGWIAKYDLQALSLVTEARVGTATSGMAVSLDGKYVAVANEAPPGLVVLDAGLGVVRSLETGSRVSAVYDAPPRKSFVAPLADLPELWEVSYDPKAEPVATGLVHDYRLREGAFVPGFLNPRRTPLEEPLGELAFTSDYRQVLGAERGRGRVLVVHLDVRRAVARMELPGLPQLGSAVSWERDGRRLMAAPSAGEGFAQVVDAQSWKIIGQIAVQGAGVRLHTHEGTPYLWIATTGGANGRDTLTVVDKRTLEVVGRFTPAPGKALAHLAFDRHGRHALASVEGSVIVLDARTLAEVKRIAAKEP